MEKNMYFNRNHTLPLYISIIQLLWSIYVNTTNKIFLFKISLDKSKKTICVQNDDRSKNDLTIFSLLQTCIDFINKLHLFKYSRHLYFTTMFRFSVYDDDIIHTIIFSIYFSLINIALRRNSLYMFSIPVARKHFESLFRSMKSFMSLGKM